MTPGKAYGAAGRAGAVLPAAATHCEKPNAAEGEGVASGVCEILRVPTPPEMVPPVASGEVGIIPAAATAAVVATPETAEAAMALCIKPAPAFMFKSGGAVMSG